LIGNKIEEMAAINIQNTPDLKNKNDEISKELLDTQNLDCNERMQITETNESSNFRFNVIPIVPAKPEVIFLISKHSHV